METGIEFTSYLRYVAALIFVLTLIWLASFVLKRSMGHRLGIKRKGDARLTISEILPIDSKHRLVLVKCDEQEHLIMLGHEHSMTIGKPICRAPVNKNLAPLQEPGVLDRRDKKEPVL